MKYAWVFIMYILVYSIFGTMLAAKQTPYLIRAFNGNSRLVTKVASYGGLVSMAGSIAISMTFPPKVHLGGLMKGQKLCARIDAFNGTGITEGRVLPLR